MGNNKGIGVRISNTENLSKAREEKVRILIGFLKNSEGSKIQQKDN